MPRRSFLKDALCNNEKRFMCICIETTSQRSRNLYFEYVFISDYQVSSFPSFSKLCCLTFSLFMINFVNTFKTHTKLSNAINQKQTIVLVI